VIEFRGEIFFSVFASSECEREPAKLPPGATTVMVRNIPTRFTSVSFLRVLDECGFRHTYDFFYLPMDFRTGKNMGYCFLNFLHSSYTIMFASLFHGRRLRMTTSTKVVEVTPSKRQGLAENVALFKASDLLGSLSLPHFKPLVLVGGALRPLSEKTFALIMGSL
jgi:RNA recognition motif-containing protein